ncbi:type II toxin-antitoxin system VapC family toxin [Micropruina sp.]|uniref:type II toxin-antitoxin system VapC family toxin n=1 Tax=Micropruina sp. TaxID=2737536 RepID=UPI0039E3D626
MNRYYLDSSVAAHAILAGGHAREWLDDVTRQDDVELVSSRLLQTELTRTLRREGVPVGDRSSVLDYVALIPITEPILAAAEAITEHTKTLDAIHLASALAVGGDLELATHDANMRRLAELLGLRVIDPVAEAP